MGMIPRVARFLILFVFVVPGRTTFAQSLPTTLPTASTAPATTSAPARYELSIPAGFVKVTVNDRNAICEAADESWVRETLAAVGAATRPTTMPVDLIQTLGAKREELGKRINDDLGGIDVAAFNKTLDDELIPQLRRLQDLKPPLFYMPISRQKLKDLVSSGSWNNPFFYYNRAANDVQWNANIALSLDVPMSDQVLPALYDTADPVERKRDVLNKLVSNTESGLAGLISGQGQASLQNALARFIDSAAIKPLDLPSSAAWFALGVEAVLSTRYCAWVIGYNADELLRNGTADDPRNPFRSRTIDLLHPTPPDQLRQGYGGVYLDALRRKSAAVINDWLIRAGTGAVGKIIAAAKQSKPADGEALAKLIQEKTGIDLTPALRPQ